MESLEPRLRRRLRGETGLGGASDAAALGLLTFSASDSADSLGLFSDSAEGDFRPLGSLDSCASFFSGSLVDSADAGAAPVAADEGVEEAAALLEGSGSVSKAAESDFFFWAP